MHLLWLNRFGSKPVLNLFILWLPWRASRPWWCWCLRLRWSVWRRPPWLGWRGWSRAMTSSGGEGEGRDLAMTSRSSGSIPAFRFAQDGPSCRRSEKEIKIPLKYISYYYFSWYSVSLFNIFWFSYSGKWKSTSDCWNKWKHKIKVPFKYCIDYISKPNMVSEVGFGSEMTPQEYLIPLLEWPQFVASFTVITCL